jgi:ferredoxin
VRINLDQDRCVSSGQCVFAAPEVFDQRDEDGVAMLLTDAPDEGSHEAVREAARVCPALAITVAES